MAVNECNGDVSPTIHNVGVTCRLETFEERSPLSLDPDCSATLNPWERELQAVAVLRPV